MVNHMKTASGTRKDGSIRMVLNRESLFRSLQSTEPIRDTSEAGRLKELENQLKAIRRQLLKTLTALQDSLMRSDILTMARLQIMWKWL